MDMEKNLSYLCQVDHQLTTFKSCEESIVILFLPRQVVALRMMEMKIITCILSQRCIVQASR